MSEKSKTQQVVKEEKKSVAVFDNSILRKAGASLNERDAEDYQIPYLKVIVSASPQRKKDNNNYIQGAEEGMIFNSVTSKLYDNLTVLPVYYRRRYTEWHTDRDKATSPLNIYTIEEYEKMKRDGRVFRNENNIEILDGGETYVQNTAEHYVIVVEEDGSWNQAIIKMKSTQLKKSRTWNSIMANQRRIDGDEIYQPKDFARSYKLSTKSVPGKKGDYYDWVINQGDWIDEMDNPNIEKIFNDAVKFEKAIHKGEVSGVEEDTSDEQVSPQKGGGDASKSGDSESDLPF
jgi:hypothetical protein